MLRDRTPPAVSTQRPVGALRAWWQNNGHFWRSRECSVPQHALPTPLSGFPTCRGILTQGRGNTKLYCIDRERYSAFRRPQNISSVMVNLRPGSMGCGEVLVVRTWPTAMATSPITHITHPISNISSNRRVENAIFFGPH